MGKGYNRNRSSQKKGEYNSKRRARRKHLKKMKYYKKDDTPLRRSGWIRIFGKRIEK